MISQLWSQKSTNSGHTRSMCDLIRVVYGDVNCLSSSKSDCIRSAEADLHNPECSSTSAGTAVNATLNASSALSDTNLAQTHSAKHDAQARLSVPNSHSQLQGEYPPCLSSDVLCGDLSPRVSHLCDSLFRNWGEDTGSGSSTIGRRRGHRFLVAEESSAV